MNYGYVKVAAAVPRVKVADCKFNAREIEKEIIIAEGKGVQIIAFPELCVTGYTCGDLFAQQLLLEEAEMGLIQIVSNTRQLDIIAILGMPIAMNGVLLNAAVVIQKGKVLGVVPKTYLPNYKEFYEKRWFTSAVDVSERSVRLCGQVVPMGTDLLFETADTTFGIEICEDLWAPIPPRLPCCPCQLSASMQNTGIVQRIITKIFFIVLKKGEGDVFSPSPLKLKSRFRYEKIYFITTF